MDSLQSTERNIKFLSSDSTMGKEKEKEVYVFGGKRGFNRLTYSGVYDLHAILAESKKYFAYRTYTFVMKEHSEKITPAGKECKIVMAPFRKVTDYVRYEVEFTIILRNGIDVLVEYKGKKRKMEKGDMEIFLKAWFRKNWKKTYKDNTLGEFFRQTFEKYIMKSELLGHETKLENEMKELWDILKDILGSYKSKE